MNTKLLVTISLGIFVGGACLYLFVRHQENQIRAQAVNEEGPRREMGFAAILAEQKGHAAA
jgi:hypothetical protein